MPQTSKHILEKETDSLSLDEIRHTTRNTDFIDQYFLFYFRKHSQFKLTIALVYSMNLFFLQF